MVAVGLARAATSGLHTIWTGLVGLGLARKLFLPAPLQPSLLAVLLPPMILHGLFDYSVFSVTTVSYAAKKQSISEADGFILDLVFFAFFVISIFASVILML